MAAKASIFLENEELSFYDGGVAVIENFIIPHSFEKRNAIGFEPVIEEETDIELRYDSEYFQAKTKSRLCDVKLEKNTVNESLARRRKMRKQTSRLRAQPNGNNDEYLRITDKESVKSAHGTNDDKNANNNDTNYEIGHTNISNDRRGKNYGKGFNNDSSVRNDGKNSGNDTSVTSGHRNVSNATCDKKDRKIYSNDTSDKINRRHSGNDTSDKSDHIHVNVTCGRNDGKHFMIDMSDKNDGRNSGKDTSDKSGYRNISNGTCDKNDRNVDNVKIVSAEFMADTKMELHNVNLEKNIVNGSNAWKWEWWKFKSRLGAQPTASKDKHLTGAGQQNGKYEHRTNDDKKSKSNDINDEFGHQNVGNNTSGKNYGKRFKNGTRNKSDGRHTSGHRNVSNGTCDINDERHFNNDESDKNDGRHSGDYTSDTSGHRNVSNGTCGNTDGKDFNNDTIDKNQSRHSGNDASGPQNISNGTCDKTEGKHFSNVTRDKIYGIMAWHDIMALWHDISDTSGHGNVNNGTCVKKVERHFNNDKSDKNDGRHSVDDTSNTSSHRNVCNCTCGKTDGGHFNNVTSDKNYGRDSSNVIIDTSGRRKVRNGTCDKNDERHFVNDKSDKNDGRHSVDDTSNTSGHRNVSDGTCDKTEGKHFSNVTRDKIYGIMAWHDIIALWHYISDTSGHGNVNNGTCVQKFERYFNNDKSDKNDGRHSVDDTSNTSGHRNVSDGTCGNTDGGHFNNDTIDKNQNRHSGNDTSNASGHQNISNGTCDKTEGKHFSNVTRDKNDSRHSGSDSGDSSADRSECNDTCDKIDGKRCNNDTSDTSSPLNINNNNTLDIDDEILSSNVNREKSDDRNAGNDASVTIGHPSVSNDVWNYAELLKTDTNDKYNDINANGETAPILEACELIGDVENESSEEILIYTAANSKRRVRSNEHTWNGNCSDEQFKNDAIAKHPIRHISTYVLLLNILVCCSWPNKLERIWPKTASIFTLQTFLRCFTLGSVLLSQEVGGTLITLPVNTTVVKNETVRMTCSTNETQHVYWIRTLAGSETEQYFYHGENGFDIKIVDGRFRVDIDEASGRYDLVITNAQPEDAGQYVCIDKSGLGERHSAELVIAGQMRCTTDIGMNDGVMAYNVFGIKQDNIQLTCNLTYKGNISPSLEWSWPGSEEQRDSPFLIRTPNSVTSMLKLSSRKELNKAKFKCQATIVGKLVSHIGLSWESLPITVYFAEFEEKTVQQCPGVKWNLVCNPECSYAFVKADSARCQCQYTYRLKDQPYSKTSDKAECPISEAEKHELLFIIGGICVMMLFLTVSFCILFLRLCLKRKYGTQNDTTAKTASTSNPRVNKDPPKEYFKFDVEENLIARV